MIVYRPGLSHRENRAALFASADPTKSGRNSPLPMHYPKNMTSGYAATRQAEDLETQNNDNIEGLSAKVRMLKDVGHTGVIDLEICF